MTKNRFLAEVPFEICKHIAGHLDIHHKVLDYPL